MNQKKDYLKKTDSFNKRSSKVKNPLFSENAFFDSCDLIQVKYEMLRQVSHDGKAITEATKEFGFSRPSFYEARGVLLKKGLSGLIPRKKGPQRAHKLDAAKLKYILEKLESGLKVTDMPKVLKEKFKITVHPRSIERALARQKKNN